MIEANLKLAELQSQQKSGIKRASTTVAPKISSMLSDNPYQNIQDSVEDERSKVQDFHHDYDEEEYYDEEDYGPEVIVSARKKSSKRSPLKTPKTLNDSPKKERQQLPPRPAGSKRVVSPPA